MLVLQTEMWKTLRHSTFFTPSYCLLCVSLLILAAHSRILRDRIQSCCSLSYDLFTASSKASSTQTAIWCFFCQFPLVSLRASSRCLSLHPYLTVTSTPPSIYPSVMCFKRQFLRKMDQSNYLFFLLL
jgi:hypothetical protein